MLTTFSSNKTTLRAKQSQQNNQIIEKKKFCESRPAAVATYQKAIIKKTNLYLYCKAKFLAKICLLLFEQHILKKYPLYLK